MSNTRDVLEGIAGMLQAAGVAVYKPDDVYQADETGIALGIMPDKPDRVITLNMVPMTDSPTMPMGLVMVQLAGRGLPNNPLDVDDLLDAAFDVLHGTTAVPLGAVVARQMNRHSSVPMRQDDLTRSERADDYWLDLDVPPTSLRPDGGSW